MTAFASAAPGFLTPTQNGQAFRESEHCAAVRIVAGRLYESVNLRMRACSGLDWKELIPNLKMNLRFTLRTGRHFCIFMYWLKNSDYQLEHISD